MIKKGQWIRTKDGQIVKVKSVNDPQFTWYTAKKKKKKHHSTDVPKSRTLINGRFELCDIAGCNDDPTYLLKVGDYINGSRILAIEMTDDKIDSFETEAVQEFVLLVDKWQVEYVVTKEQFEKVEVRI